jgi:hypothetical protein
VCFWQVKRAIQFGSRIAKHANVGRFGSNRRGKGDRWRGAWEAAEGEDEEEDVDDGPGDEDDLGRGDS